MEFIEFLSEKFHFTFQQKKQMCEFETDLKMWQERSLSEILNERGLENFKNGKEIFEFSRQIWQNFKENRHSYKNFSPKYEPKNFKISSFKAEKIALGRCPVASENTRCCNLLTLDAVNSCGFDCSYCAVQSFYKGGSVGFDENFTKNLQNLKLSHDRIYHIGTGQSSDSLMWGDRFGELTALCEFARQNQNVILELKSKSKNVKFLLENEIPRNIIVTFSLNPQTIIENEEHLTVSLNERLEAAKKLANNGVLVGFHFHPMIWYDDFFRDYAEIFAKILENFKPENVALISLGTLTFTKNVIKKIRERKIDSKILQMPFCEINGKFSYPHEIKREMFKFAYESLAKWHGKVFFYLCMEEKSLWSEVFGFEFSSNDEFENAMKSAYLAKIRS